MDGWNITRQVMTCWQTTKQKSGAWTRKTMNVNILQTQFHSCFCVQAKHNSSWPSFTTTGPAAWLFSVCFVFLNGRPVSPLPSVFSVYSNCGKSCRQARRDCVHAPQRHMLFHSRDFNLRSPSLSLFLGICSTYWMDKGKEAVVRQPVLCGLI